MENEVKYYIKLIGNSSVEQLLSMYKTLNDNDKRVFLSVMLSLNKRLRIIGKRQDIIFKIKEFFNNFIDK